MSARPCAITTSSERVFAPCGRTRPTSTVANGSCGSRKASRHATGRTFCSPSSVVSFAWATRSAAVCSLCATRRTSSRFGIGRRTRAACACRSATRCARSCRFLITQTWNTRSTQIRCATTRRTATLTLTSDLGGAQARAGRGRQGCVCCAFFHTWGARCMGTLMALSAQYQQYQLACDVESWWRAAAFSRSRAGSLHNLICASGHLYTGCTCLSFGALSCRVFALYLCSLFLRAIRN
mmetsp:Transcript_40531/g.107272  ORF Transcript_40531/g.107272 Transcript_40531/m.107272 type:complete len:238 (+) Transcript_40531:267-980(+)